MSYRYYTYVTDWMGITALSRLLGVSTYEVQKELQPGGRSIEVRDCPPDRKTHARQKFEYRAVERIEYTNPNFVPPAPEEGWHREDRRAAVVAAAEAVVAARAAEKKKRRQSTAVASLDRKLHTVMSALGQTDWMIASHLHQHLGLTRKEAALLSAERYFKYVRIQTRWCPPDRKQHPRQRLEWCVSLVQQPKVKEEKAQDTIYPVFIPAAGLPDMVKIVFDKDAGDIQRRIDEYMSSKNQDETTAEAIVRECDALKALLLEKNRKYGDSALNPQRIFAKSDAVEQINVRIDDKLSRRANQQADEDEDVVQDLMGYMVLLRIALRRRRTSQEG